MNVKSKQQRTSSAWTAPQRAVLIVLGVAILAIAAVRFALNPKYISTEPTSEPSPELIDQIDPNDAPWPALAALPTIGEQRARQIVAYREEFLRDHPGAIAFERLEDLEKVKGIGPATVQQLRPYLVFPSDP